MAYQTSKQRAKYQDPKERSIEDPIFKLSFELGDEEVRKPVVYIRQSKDEASKS
jgi:hypothetical protein